MVAPRKTLLPIHRHLYQKETYDYAHNSLTLGGIAGRLALTLVILVGATLLGVVLPTRHHNSIDSEAQWMGSFLIGLLMAGSYFYTALWHPLFGQVRAYRWVGKFTVAEKYPAFGTKLLRLSPDNNQTIRVEDQLFGIVSVGDQVRVVYTAYYELVSVAKVAGPAQK